MSGWQRWRSQPKGNRGGRQARRLPYANEWKCDSCGCEGNWGHNAHCLSSGQDWRTAPESPSSWDKPDEVANLIAGLTQAKTKEESKQIPPAAAKPVAKTKEKEPCPDTALEEMAVDEDQEEPPLEPQQVLARALKALVSSLGLPETVAPSLAEVIQKALPQKEDQAAKHRRLQSLNDRVRDQADTLKVAVEAEAKLKAELELGQQNQTKLKTTIAEIQHITREGDGSRRVVPHGNPYPSEQRTGKHPSGRGIEPTSDPEPPHPPTASRDPQASQAAGASPPPTAAEGLNSHQNIRGLGATRPAEETLSDAPPAKTQLSMAEAFGRVAQAIRDPQQTTS